MANYELIKSNKGGNFLVLCNNIHRKTKVIDDKSYWSCIQPNCKGKVNLIGDTISSITEHSHEPDTAKLIEIKQRNAAKEIAKSDNYCNLKLTYHSATNKVLNTIPVPQEEIAPALKSFHHMKRTIARARASRFPSLPKSLNDIEIPSNLQFSSTEKFFKVSDGGNDKILFFATDAFLRHLCEANHVYADGTFKSVPLLFHSLYTLHVMRNEVMIPVVYALIPDASMQTYIRLFRLVQDACTSLGLIWQPTKFTTDFEIATIKAINIIFPFCELKCCLFHFSQSLWRNVGKFGLVNRYKANDDNVKLSVKRISALPFLKTEDIVDAYNAIKASAPDDDDMIGFLTYFETHICMVTLDSRKKYGIIMQIVTREPIIMLKDGIMD
ncbi:uncharacterized protein LOC107369738 [Tetranychus urticae]|uniref:uncharacterized protein LOC107369738 n=1 Tax=Tetranychus urticae TaxID=32264 RepID=UPI000D653C77|nr:uncharacterized protein LOC107369738 [Tetranychus urticae]